MCHSIHASLFTLIILFYILPSCLTLHIEPIGSPIVIPLSSKQKRKQQKLHHGAFSTKSGTIDASGIFHEFHQGRERNLRKNGIEIQLFEDEAPIQFSQLLPRVRNITDGGGVDEKERLLFAENENLDSLSLLSTGGHSLVGSITHGEVVYNIRTSPAGNVTVDTIRIQDLPPEEKYSHEATDQKYHKNRDLRRRYHERKRSDQDDGSVIDVIVFYTKTAMCNEAINSDTCKDKKSNQKPMRDRIELAVEQTNHAFTSSGVNTMIRLVYAGLADDPVSYENPTPTKGLNQVMHDLIGQDDGFLDNVHVLRNKYGADLVHLIVERSEHSCGAGNSYSADPNNAFSVTKRACVTSSFSFAHEVGHNFGCYHDRINTNIQNSKEYFFGYQDPKSRFRTILSLNCWIDCPRVMRYSNNQFQMDYNGKLLPVGDNKNDCARVINDRRGVIANFRKSSVKGITSAPTSAPITALPTSALTSTLISAPTSMPPTYAPTGISFDTTSISGVKFSSSNTVSSSSSANAFDNDPSTATIFTRDFPVMLTISYPDNRMFQITTYNLQVARDRSSPEAWEAGRNKSSPKNWELQGRTKDGNSWVLLDTVRNARFKKQSHITTFEVDYPGHYSEYRFKFISKTSSRIAAKSMMISEIHLFGEEVASPPSLQATHHPASPPTYAPTGIAFDTTNIPGVKFSRSKTISSSSSANAFDNDPFTATIFAKQFPVRLKITYPDNRVFQITTYKLEVTSSKSSPEALEAGQNESFPKAWELQGKRKGSNSWVILDTVMNANFDKQSLMATFEVDSPGHYRKYRFKFVSTSSRIAIKNMAIAEIHLFGEEIISAPMSKPSY